MNFFLPSWSDRNVGERQTGRHFGHVNEQAKMIHDSGLKDDCVS
jgi:hypothetical protein